MAKRGARLGQHFLTGVWAARKLAEAAAKEGSETILEVGPGKGALTRELLASGKRVVAVEKDETLSAFLESEFAGEITSRRFALIQGDIRNFSPGDAGLRSGEYTVAANIPYYITGEIIRAFLTAPAQPRAMFLLVQKEVAQRIVSAKESLLSLSVKAYGSPKIIERVSRGNFSPPPSVDSAIIGITGISRANFEDLDERAFFKIARLGFSSKRKFLLNNLSTRFGKERVGSAFCHAGLDKNIRAESVPLKAWLSLARSLGA